MLEPVSALIFGVCLTASPTGFSRRFGETAASLEWIARGRGSTSSQYNDGFTVAETRIAHSIEVAASLDLSDLANALWSNTRPMEKWERKELDEFTWSEFDT